MNEKNPIKAIRASKSINEYHAKKVKLGYVISIIEMYVQNGYFLGDFLESWQGKTTQELQEQESYLKNKFKVE